MHTYTIYNTYIDYSVNAFGRLPTYVCLPCVAKYEEDGEKTRVGVQCTGTGIRSTICMYECVSILYRHGAIPYTSFDICWGMFVCRGQVRNQHTHCWPISRVVDFGSIASSPFLLVDCFVLFFFSLFRCIRMKFSSCIWFQFILFVVSFASTFTKCFSEHLDRELIYHTLNKKKWIKANRNGLEWLRDVQRVEYQWWSQLERTKIDLWWTLIENIVTQTTNHSSVRRTNKQKKQK